MTKKPMLTAGVTVGAAVLALTVGSFVIPQGSIASAQGVAKQSSQAVAKLSPADKQKLNERIGGSPEELLREAQQAKDLKVLTYDQAMAMMPGGMPPSDGKHSQPDLHGLKFLKYTNAQGATVILGLDAQKMPVFASVMMMSGNPGDKGGSAKPSFRQESSTSEPTLDNQGQGGTTNAAKSLDQSNNQGTQEVTEGSGQGGTSDHK